MCARTRSPAPAGMAGFRALIVDPAAIARAGELGMAWNDERVELLKKLWSDGLSASQIAGRLGGVTRNAVIGKVHRLGLSGRATSSRSSSPRPRRAHVPRQNRAPSLLFSTRATVAPKPQYEAEL